MATPLESAEDLQYRLFAVQAVPVRFRRDSTPSGGVAALFAKIAKTLFRAENEYAVTIRTELRDFIVRSADLVIDGSAVEPAAGDVFEFDGHDYVVGAPNNEDVWRWSDRLHHRMMRVHARYNGLTGDTEAKA